MTEFSPEDKADLQIHSIYSDGKLTPEEIIREAVQNGVKVIAITDHGTGGGVIEAIEAGDKLGVNVIPGVEFGTGGKRRIDILGYNYNVTMMQGILKQHGNIKNIAQEILRGELSHNPYLYVKYIIDLIHNAGGYAVVAHARRPGFIVTDEEIIRFISMGLDGVEVYYPLHSTYDTQQLYNLAKQHKLMITGGTDFHSFQKKPIVHIGDVFVQVKYIQKLLQEP